MTTRRAFILIPPLAGAAALRANAAFADAARVDPKDPQATAFGHVQGANLPAGAWCGACEKKA